MSKNIDYVTDPLFFWNTSRKYLYDYHKQIRKSSPNTIKAYRIGINTFIEFLETQKNQDRKTICFNDLNRENLNSFIEWMSGDKGMSGKTCNLKITALHSLLEYAAYEQTELMPVYMNALTVKGVKLESHPIEFFEPSQMKGILEAPDISRRTGRRNQMMLILLYDTGARVQEVLDLKLESLHLDAEVPYITLHGKGDYYRNVPIMDKTITFLKKYLKEFHPVSSQDAQLFYAVSHGNRHQMSPDSLENLIKQCADACRKKNIEMPASCHCHMIRKTRAMDLYQAGMSLEHIQQLLGHKHISTTSGFYAFATLETLSNAIAKVDEGATKETKKWDNPEVLEKLYSL